MIKIPSKIKYLSYAGIIPVLIGVIGSLELNFISNNIKSFYALNGLAGETSEIELEPGYFRVQRGSGYCYTTHPSDFKGLIEHLSINI